jgi:ABC-type Fe3+ transport system substrate-binding protein
MRLQCLVCFFIFVQGFMCIAQEKLVIISPHRKSVQREFIPAFKEFYKSSYGAQILVEWVDQGGAENDLKFVMSRFRSNAKSSKLDVFWGGGELIFRELDKLDFLLPTTLPSALESAVPTQVMGLQLKSAKKTWYASALSTFGIFYNKVLLKRLRIPEPKSWQDLAADSYTGLVSVADPRHSSTALMMDLIMLQSMGWEKGWRLLTLLAANTGKFTHSSSDPIKAVTYGQSVVATSIDFYANAKIAELGSKNLGFVAPHGESIFNSDPIGILKGAQNRLQAQRFVEFILSTRGQKLLLLPKGAQGGPKYTSLGRIAVNRGVYGLREVASLGLLNPFAMPDSKFDLDLDYSVKIKAVVADLIGAYHIDMHKELKSAKKKLKAKKQTLDRLCLPPISQKELVELAKRWHDGGFRNEKIRSWSQQARLLYLSFL